MISMILLKILIMVLIILLTLLIKLVIPECEDEYPDCLSRAEAGECGGGVVHPNTEVVLAALVDCRPSCRQFYREEQEPEIVRQLGGLEDVVTDVFGAELNVCSKEEGMDRLMRYSILRHRLIAVKSSPWVPSFTLAGWKQVDIPSHLKGMLAMARLRGKSESETCMPSITAFNCQVLVEDYEECRSEHNNRQQVIPLDSQLKDTILSTLQPMGEDWAGVSLTGTSVYGIRRYKNGSWLAAHVDQMATHVISAILNIGQRGDPWPLHIMDHDGKTHQVLLQEGQMVWYESAKLQHARPFKFSGEYFDNVFVHFKPRDRKWYSRDVMQIKWEKDEVPKKKISIQLNKNGQKALKVDKVKMS